MARAGICAVLFSATISSVFLSSATTEAATTHHRLTWDSDPAHNAVIGFSPDGSSNAPHVKYGFSTDEAQWVSQQPTSSQQFNNGFLSYFVRLTNLPEDSAIYYRVCDNSGCGERFWFKTAPTDTKPFVAVAGGDSRTGWTTRRAGNSLIAKIRPLFIMHGGDFTNANNIAEIKEFLSDWTLTFSNDTINNIPYKQIYPLIPTHGNHEDNNFRTLCQVFGVDYNGDGQCTTADTYGAFNISPLLRVYTLNTQYANSGWSSYANAMNTWLADDLYANGTDTTWRFAQYHKPMFPHYTGKRDNPHLFSWWANHFYNYAMNLVVESDTHINKLTKAIRPSGTTFVETTTGGTVYVGEGSWGAPARSANNPRPWTIDLASIQQFKVITVTEENIEVRTAQFDDTASTLTRAQRNNNPTLLPANVNWWSANSIGEKLILVQNAAGQSIIDNGITNGNTVELPATHDTFVSTSQATQNFNGSSEGLLADGLDTTYGAMNALIKWNLASIPACAIITSASVKLNVTNSSPGNYLMHNGVKAWSEQTATWNSIGGTAHRGAQLASFTASSTGIKTIPLSSSGIAVVQSWLQGNNNGIVITSGGTTDGIDIRSKEQGIAPILVLEYQQTSGCDTNTASFSKTTQAEHY
ncbi:MAG TPA: DNRLRE domain-containing protein, partial [Cellvibrio sp.]|nr:DNRLRE domain-containing protein [Cellvibrio sp.]